MQQKEFETLLSLLKETIHDGEINAECYNTMKQDRVLLHQLGLFETQNVVSLFKDKIALQTLNIQQHDLIGMDTFFQKLIIYTEPYLLQFIITTSKRGYLLILSPGLSELIGVLKNPKLDFEKDLQQQRQLIQMGHPNQELFLFDKGIFIEVVKL